MATPEIHHAGQCVMLSVVGAAGFGHEEAMCLCLFQRFGGKHHIEGFDGFGGGDPRTVPCVVGGIVMPCRHLGGIAFF